MKPNVSVGDLVEIKDCFGLNNYLGICLKIDTKWDYFVNCEQYDCIFLIQDKLVTIRVYFRYKMNVISSLEESS